MDELKFITTPERWPNFVLPMCKRGGDFMDDDFCGLVFPGKPVVVIGNLLGGKPAADAKRFEYASFEDLLKEWRVD